jgi:hypothetical protein
MLTIEAFVLLTIETKVSERTLFAKLSCGSELVRENILIIRR